MYGCMLIFEEILMCKYTEVRSRWKASSISVIHNHVRTNIHTYVHCTHGYHARISYTQKSKSTKNTNHVRKFGPLIFIFIGTCVKKPEEKRRERENRISRVWWKCWIAKAFAVQIMSSVWNQQIKYSVNKTAFRFRFYNHLFGAWTNNNRKQTKQTFLIPKNLRVDSDSRFPMVWLFLCMLLHLLPLRCFLITNGQANPIPNKWHSECELHWAKTAPLECTFISTAIGYSAC